MSTTLNFRPAAEGESPAIDLVSARQLRLDMGISHVTLWRWTKAGHLHPRNLYGRLYLSRKELAEFQRRIEDGEFRRTLPVP
jgi:predicted site-specific integrase-resolvase